MRRDDGGLLSGELVGRGEKSSDAPLAMMYAGGGVCSPLSFANDFSQEREAGLIAGSGTATCVTPMDRIWGTQPVPGAGVGGTAGKRTALVGFSRSSRQAIKSTRFSWEKGLLL